MIIEHKVRSFFIILYDHAFTERMRFSLPVTVVIPFGNRLFRELLPEHEQNTREPWYELRPHSIHEPPIPRSPQPEGFTSLTGTRYIPEAEPPPRVTLHPEAHVCSFTVRVFDLQTELWRGEYSVEDIFRAGAESLARAWTEKGRIRLDDAPLYYEVLTSIADVRTIPQDLFPPEAYAVEGVFRLPQLAPERERIPFRKVESPPWPERALTAYSPTRTYGRGQLAEGKVLMHARVYEALREKLSLSRTVEDGGYLLGQPYRQAGSPESEEDSAFQWLVEITDVILAEGTRSNLLSLLFTGETWSRVTRRIDRDYPDKKLVSWFHTHLFKATDEFGLSGMDEDLHRRFFSRPWQVAVLLNVDVHGSREVRCFQRTSSGDLVECPFDVFDTSPEESAS